MIKRRKEYVTEVIQQMRGGEGEFVIEHLVDKAVLGMSGRLFAKGTLKSGHSVGWHCHETDMEICHILNGVATVYDNDETPHELKAGDTHVCLPGQRHSIVNRGTETLEYLAVVLYPDGSKIDNK